MKDKRNKECAVISKYVKITNELIRCFYDRYYNDENEPPYKDDFRIIGDWEHGPGTVNIVDEYWQIDDIFTALNNDISEKILFDRHSYQLDHFTEDKEGNPTNLRSYNLKNKEGNI